MAIDIDGAAILSAMIKDPDTFGYSKAQIDSLAEYALFAKLREKNVTLETLRMLAGSVGSKDFRKLIGNLPDKDAKALAKLDGKHPDFKEADANWHRSQIIKLSEGEVEPTKSTKAPKKDSGASKPPRSRTSKIGVIMGSEALAAGARQRQRSTRKSKDNPSE